MLIRLTLIISMFKLVVNYQLMVLQHLKLEKNKKIKRNFKLFFLELQEIKDRAPRTAEELFGP